MLDSEHTYDVVVLGAGGAGCAAAIEASYVTSNLLLVTDGTLTDSKTYQAQGGIQAALGANDSPDKHRDDTLRAGQYANDPKLVQILADSARPTIQWLEGLGVKFDKRDGAYALQAAAGLSEPRILSVADQAGRGIVAALIKATQQRNIRVAEQSAVYELEKHGDTFRLNVRTNGTPEAVVLHARAVVICTGGFLAREKAQGYSDVLKASRPDGIALAESLGAVVVCPELVQYHPTGVLLPSELRRVRLPETMRGAGAILLNRHREPFVDSLLTRNLLTQAIVKECEAGNGVDTEDGRRGVWLDTPRIDAVNGPGFTQQRFPSFVQMFGEHGRDLRREPVLVYPVLHYSLGGVQIDEHCQTSVPGCYAAGEVTWGVHGKDRLMGNSLLEVFVFGRIAGRSAARHALDGRHA